MNLPRTREELLTILDDLAADLHSARNNPGSYRCDDCVGCVDCQFCRSSEHCQGSSYLVECVRCLDSTHCARSEDLIRCSQTQESQRCTQSAYLLFSRDCHSCNYCFGCVGLRNKDFHIFNQPYSRTEYFKKVAALKKSLQLP